MGIRFQRVNAPANADIAYKAINDLGDEFFVAGLIRQSFAEGKPTAWGKANTVEAITSFGFATRGAAAKA